MEIFNLFGEQDWDDENDREGFRHRATAIGKRLGAELLGGSLYELPPGEKTWPYHYELGCEEWLIAVSGRPTLRGPDGERELEPGDIAVFPEGPAGAHQVLNRSEEPCRVLILSSIAGGDRPLPGQREGRPLDRVGRVPGDAAGRAGP